MTGQEKYDMLTKAIAWAQKKGDYEFAEMMRKARARLGLGEYIPVAAKEF